MTAGQVDEVREPTFLREWDEIDLSMTNLDHSVDDGMAEALTGRPVFGRHAGWEFNGLVWWAAGRFHEAVYRFHEFRAVYAADTLEDLMRVVNDEWGWG